MTWPEVEDLLSRTDMVIIPVPAIEQHGPQLPIGTDYFTGEELAKLTAQRTDVLVAPILLPGISQYHMEFPGRSPCPRILFSAFISRLCKVLFTMASADS
jgi:creatinine amidohydrolase